MQAIGLLFIFTAALMARQVAVGRATHIPQDFRSILTGVLRNDVSMVKTTLAERGTNVTPVNAASKTVNGDTANYAAGSNLESEMRKLAAACNNKYGWGKTGPDEYDCSGLVWRACRNLHIYTGPRFTSGTFPLVAGKFAQRVSDPKPGDIVVWQYHHMGIVINGGRMYSALNRKQGILETPISYGGSGNPQYWRVNAGTVQA